MEKKTKEGLVKENALLEKRVEESGENDRIRRANLSVFLNAPMKKRGQYDYSDERITYAWPEIYFHLGKLVSERNDFSFRENTRAELSQLAGELDTVKSILSSKSPTT